VIIHTVAAPDPSLLRDLCTQYGAITFQEREHRVLVLSSKVRELDPRFSPLVREKFVFDDDIQLASARYRSKKREVRFGNIVIGGDTAHTVFMAGPCSVESREQMETVCERLVKDEIRVLRAGAFKPRTSPYVFQGLGNGGLSLLAEMRQKYGLSVVTEVRDATHVEAVIEVADIVQIGAKAMYDHGILRACGKSRKPVLLKRGFGSTLQELVQAAEFMLSSGNENVILCERGIRTFETKTRFTLDLCGVAYLKQHVNLPVVVDTSHAMGYRYGVPDLTRAACAMGVDGLLIESHPTPDKALSDAAQQVDLDTLSEMVTSVRKIARAVGRTIV
jgi:3-deoxy-7-phosphoheptulonate synthase